MNLAPGEIPLWDELDVGHESAEALEWAGGAVVRNVVRPTLAPMLPAAGHESGTAVIVCPGGAFHFLSIENEGFAVARWLRDRGHAAHVLKYRLAPTALDAEGFQQDVIRAFSDREHMVRVMAERQTDAAADGLRAVELVRPLADRVVLLGFSAGGRLAAEVLRAGGDRGPDAAAVVYLPTVDGEVPAGPPLFLLAAGDDPLGIAGSLALHRSWREAGRPVELHLYERGGHGFGMHPQGLPVDGWIERFAEWLGVTDGRS